MKFTDMLRAAAGRPRLDAVRRAGPGAGEVPRRLAWRRRAHLRLLRRHRRRHAGTWSAPSSRRSPTSPRSAPKTQLERLIEHIHRVAPGVPVILDAKRGDIGATAEQYAREAFERYRADALTLSPFMGFDSIEPYLRHADKGLILLCRTSNPGGSDLQSQRLASGEHALRAHRPAGRGAVERRRPARPGGRRHLSRARSPACASWRRRCRC